jgi:hypothetical protein
VVCRRIVEAAERVGRGVRLGAVPSGGQRERAFRTTVMLAAVFVINLFDLALTQSQMARGNFAEANIVAAALVSSPGGVAMYKALLFGLGALILYRLRDHPASEMAAAGLLACHIALIGWWLAYLHAVEVCLSDVAVNGAIAPL